MKIFVPKYRDAIPHGNPHIMNSMFVEIDPSDLKNVTIHWDYIDRITDPDRLKEFFATNVKQVCRHKPKKKTLEPYLRRPHITIHAGAKKGAEHCREILQQAAYQAAYEAAKNGYNVWYGGGDEGLMGQIAKGFHDAIKEFGRRPDQYIIQVSPADFAVPPESGNQGLVVNEGLAEVTDIALVVKDFDARRALLDNRCMAAITCPGGTGTLDEFTDMLVHNKTGLREQLIFVIDPLIPRPGKKNRQRMFGHLRQQIKFAIECGMDRANVLDLVTFAESASAVFAKLNSRGISADAMYAQYCQENAIELPINTGKIIPIRQDITSATSLNTLAAS